MKLLSFPRRPSEDEERRFWSYVNKRGPDECWPWLSRADGCGYGRFSFGGSCGGFVASRVAYLLAHGEEAQGFVCHSCDNPSCVNPAHLWVGTSSDNARDCSLKGRHRGQSQTHCVNGHQYTPENTYHRPGRIAGRDCRACIRERARTYQQRKATA